MNLYIAEIVVAIVIAIILIVILKVKKIKKIGLSIGILVTVFIITLGVTFVLEKPTVNIISRELNIEVKQGNSVPKPKTQYHFKDVTNTVKVVGNVDFNKPGEYQVKYQIPTFIGTYETSQTVHVVDTTSPKIILKGEQTYLLSYTKEYEEPGYTVIDNYDENLLDMVKVEKQEISETEYNLIYTVQDSSGNKAEEIRKVYIIDDVAPVIKLNGYEGEQIVLGSKYEEKGATAKDEKDGDLTSQIKITGSVDTSKIGTYEITYKVSDKSGNEAIKIRKVRVNKEIMKDPTTNTGVIYLTFDDGPSASITPKILDILKQKNVKATFFILNYDTYGEELVKREIAEGHTVGIHGYSHDYGAIYQSVDAYMNNVTKLQEKIKASTGYNTKFTRFPGGSSNTVSKFNPGIMTTLSKEVVARGYKYFDWNISSEDAGGAKDSRDVYNNVTKSLSKNKTNLVLMHDFGGNTKTLNALADIIDYGLKNGYTFSNITENTPMIVHHINN